MKNRLRIFIVGCPRSGTTLLQSMLASHPELTSFTESHFISTLLSERWWLRKMGLGSPRARERLKEFLEENNVGEFYEKLSPFTVRISSYMDQFIHILDQISVKRKTSGWIEKTPHHLHYISEIEHWVGHPLFLHIVRNGPDVIASLVETTRNHPEEWGKVLNTTQASERWLNDLKITSQMKNEPNHFEILYENLVVKTEDVLQQICKFIGVSFNTSMIEDFYQNSSKIITGNEEWKQENTQNLRTHPRGKFEHFFTKDEQAQIISELKQHLSEDDFDLLQPYMQ